MAFLDRILEANRRDPTAFIPFVIEGSTLGWIRSSFAERLAGYSSTFSLHHHRITLTKELEHGSVTLRTQAVDEVVADLCARGVIQGVRDERYPVAPTFDAPPRLLLERAALPHFGVRGYGVHLNGYVNTPTGWHMWVARRAVDKPTFPGELDQIVAGGQPVGISVFDNLLKESAEEAQIPGPLARQSRPVSVISYALETPSGLRPDVIFAYDLELPASFEPINADGEVESFHLWPMTRVIDTVRSGNAFKFNCSLVVVDFLCRHGYIGPEEPDYVAIVHGLRTPQSLETLSKP